MGSGKAKRAEKLRLYKTDETTEFPEFFVLKNCLSKFVVWRNLYLLMG